MKINTISQNFTSKLPKPKKIDRLGVYLGTTIAASMLGAGYICASQENHYDDRKTLIENNINTPETILTDQLLEKLDLSNLKIEKCDNSEIHNFSAEIGHTGKISGSFAKDDSTNSIQGYVHYKNIFKDNNYNFSMCYTESVIPWVDIYEYNIILQDKNNNIHKITIEKKFRDNNVYYNDHPLTNRETRDVKVFSAVLIALCLSGVIAKGVTNTSK